MNGVTHASQYVGGFLSVVEFSIWSLVQVVSGCFPYGLTAAKR